jgi:hypothetical protein
MDVRVGFTIVSLQTSATSFNFDNEIDVLMVKAGYDGCQHPTPSNVSA